VYTSSILVVASINIINILHRLFDGPGEVPHGDQQLAHQPSGNGIRGQGSWLSFAAFGGAFEVGKCAGKSSSGAGSIAILTASSNRSNSASLIARS
jgi:hypothetical protein